MDHLHTRGNFSRKNWQSSRSSSRTQRRRWWHMQTRSKLSRRRNKDQQPLADLDLLSLNAALQQVRTERIRAQEQWEQASKNKELVLPQVLNDKSIQVLERQARDSRFRL